LVLSTTGPNIEMLNILYRFTLLRSVLTLPLYVSTPMGSTFWPSWKSTTWRAALNWVPLAAPQTASCSHVEILGPRRSGVRARNPPVLWEMLLSNRGYSLWHPPLSHFEGITKKKDKSTSPKNAVTTDPCHSTTLPPLVQAPSGPQGMQSAGRFYFLFSPWVKHKPIVNDVIDVFDWFSYYLVHLVFYLVNSL